MIKAPSEGKASGIVAKLAELPQLAFTALVEQCRKRPGLTAVLLLAACGGGSGAPQQEDAGCALPREIIADGSSGGGDGGADGGNFNRLAGVEPSIEAGHDPAIRPGSETNNGLDYRVAFNIPPFDQRTIPGFEEGCTAWPLEVKVRAHLVRNPSNPAKGPDEDTVLLGDKGIWAFGPDFVDFRMPDEFCSLTSYEIELQTPDGQRLTASPSVAVKDFGVGRLATPPADGGIPTAAGE